MGHTIKHVADLFERSRETIRLWSGVFEPYLSPGATPGKGRTRQFNADDLRVFALVVELKDQGKTYEDVMLALANGQRGRVPQREITPAATQGQEIEQYKAMIVALREEAQEWKLKAAIADAKREMAEERIALLERRMEELLIRIGKLEAARSDQ